MNDQRFGAKLTDPQRRLCATNLAMLREQKKNGNRPPVPYERPTSILDLVEKTAAIPPRHVDFQKRFTQ